METKFVIIMHNRDDFSFEESPLLDEYPTPDIIKAYLLQSNYRYAKVEKRYFFKDQYEPPKQETYYKVVWLDDNGQFCKVICTEKELPAYREMLSEQDRSFRVIRLN